MPKGPRGEKRPADVIGNAVKVKPPMETPADKRRRFRAHAEELRALSDKATFPDVKAQLLDIAGQYDGLADEAERRDRDNSK